ncbi:MAG: hypothetical protein HUJ91_06580 [Bacteroidales bacterium]|nr:hypothetical protein [Bacteroidales bacterium]
MKDYVGLYDVPSKHLSNLNPTQHGAVIERTVDTVHYCASLNWSRGATLSQVSPHRFEITPDSTSGRIDLCIRFSKKASEAPIATSATRLVRRIERLSAREWKRYWESGAAIDLSGSTDPRWMELERRAVLSQYIMKLNETGTFFPQESGLVRNTWYGRSHLEMVWWHAVHFALWGRPKEFGSYMECYRDFLPEARARAAEEGRTGARWPKCVGEINREWPGDAHAFLLWQMPHPIYFAEQIWRENPSEATLEQWREIVLETAAYMADNLFYDEQRGEYVMGPPVYMVSENAAAGATVNPCFELAYWRYGLETALKWQERLGIERNPRWEDILQHLAPLPVEDGLYVSYEGIEGQWSEKNFEHPAITGIYGMLPGNGVDTAAVARTLEKVVGCWQWGDRIWGWDFPMMAMCAARCGMPELALDLLLHPCFKAQFDPHGYSKSWPIPYFPANGGELAAIAMMCGGWDGCDTTADAPGFPRDGTWKVRHEGFRKMQ